jgi:SecD/SecF fusion protein
MYRNLRWRIPFILILLALSVYYLLPTLKLATLSEVDRIMLEKEDPARLVALERAAVKLGLDLQGGMHIVLEVDDSRLSDEEKKDAIDRALEIIRNRIDQFGVSEPLIQKEGDRRIIVELPGLRVRTDFGWEVEQTTDGMRIAYLDTTKTAYVQGVREGDVILWVNDQETRTQEAFEAAVSRAQTHNEMRLGLQDTMIVLSLGGSAEQRAKSLIGATALLEFRLLSDPALAQQTVNRIDSILAVKYGDELGETIPYDESVSDTVITDIFSTAPTDTTASDTTYADDTTDVGPEFIGPFTELLVTTSRSDVGVDESDLPTLRKYLNDRDVIAAIPEDMEIALSSKPVIIGDTRYFNIYFLKKRTEVTGKYLVDANPAQDTRFGGWLVQFRLNRAGGKKFATLTGANIGKPMAIVLDGKVSQVATIRDKIRQDGVIEGNYSFEEARDLAIVLRAGALPAPVVVIENRTIGPSLGHDSILQGITSVLVGMGLVFLFMLAYYRLSGGVALFALVFNIVFLIAVMAGLSATLTLPGIAGIILTIGMAVDANVLIFERIREELSAGKPVTIAIEQGYKRAFTTIFDANVTTLITALILFQFGTGPIKGFAITLSLGIVISMFTALVVTRVIFDLITRRYDLARLSI